MPITKSAKKALKGSLVKKAMNDRNKKAIKEATIMEMTEEES